MPWKTKNNNKIKKPLLLAVFFIPQNLFIGLVDSIKLATNFYF